MAALPPALLAPRADGVDGAPPRTSVSEQRPGAEVSQLPVLERRLALARPRADLGSSSYGFGVLPGFGVGWPGGGESVGQSGKNGIPQISGGGAGIGQSAVGPQIPPHLPPS